MPRRVLDLGCGAGPAGRALLKEAAFTEVVGVDVSVRALNVAARRLRAGAAAGERQAPRVEAHAGLARLHATAAEGIRRGRAERGRSSTWTCRRLPALEYAVFGAARPRTVLVTTPNVEYNVRWETLPAGHVRHRDHRFEWTREEFRAWADAVAGRHGYEVASVPSATDDPEVGPPTQMAVFTDDAGTTDRRTGGRKAA